jgi:hypothetical protein
MKKQTDSNAAAATSSSKKKKKSRRALVGAYFPSGGLFPTSGGPSLASAMISRRTAKEAAKTRDSPGESDDEEAG